MIKNFILTVIMVCTLYANNHKTIEASYDISYGFFGKLGVAHTIVTIDHNNYSIKIVAKATGLAKILSNGKEEIYISTGTIANNTFIPKSFIKHAYSNNKKRTKKYTFDYTNNKILLEKETHRLEQVNKNPFHQNYENNDIIMEPETKWVKEQSSETLDYFSSNDLLSLFFNMNKFVPNFNQGSNYSLTAIGASKDKGKIDIIIPRGEKYKDLENSLEIESSKKFIAYINQKIFSSKRGELFISLNDYGICNKAVLKDVLLFGDIIGEMTDFTVKES